MITEAEEKLLDVLKNDVRASISDIARKLHISRATVQARIAKLEHIGVIKGYTLDLGKEYLDNFVSAHVLISTTQEFSAQVSIDLFKISEVTEIHSITGEFDLIAVVTAKNSEILNGILGNIARLKGVERTNSAVRLATKQRG